MAYARLLVLGIGIIVLASYTLLSETPGIEALDTCDPQDRSHLCIELQNSRALPSSFDDYVVVKERKADVGVDKICWTLPAGLEKGEGAVTSAEIAIPPYAHKLFAGGNSGYSSKLAPLQITSGGTECYELVVPRTTSGKDWGVDYSVMFQVGSAQPRVDWARCYNCNNSGDVDPLKPPRVIFADVGLTFTPITEETTLRFEAPQGFMVDSLTLTPRDSMGVRGETRVLETDTAHVVPGVYEVSMFVVGVEDSVTQVIEVADAPRVLSVYGSLPGLQTQGK